MSISRASFWALCLLAGLTPLPEAEAVKQAKVRGLGASFPSDVYQTWIASYKASRQQYVDLEMTYASDSSGAGKQRIIAKDSSIEYAGSDFLLNATETAAQPDLVMFPTMAGGTVLAYNLRECSSGSSLNLTRHHVVGIYNGTYRFWNDSSMQKVNPNCKLPSQRILVIARSDESGTTAMFSEALTSFSAEWEATFGVFAEGADPTTDKPKVWNESVIYMLANGNSGMVGLVKSLRYSIGYMSVSVAREQHLPYAFIQNHHGNFMQPTKEAVQAAMDSWASSPNLTVSLADGGLSGAYPIAGYTYLVMYRTQMTQCDSAKELVRYVQWFLETPSAHRDCEDKEMVPLSQKVAGRVQSEVLQTVLCAGRSMWEEVQADMAEENAARNTWLLPVSVSLPLFAAIVLGLLGYILWQRYKLIRMIENDEWDVPIEEIIFYEDKQGASGGKSQLYAAKSLKSFVSINDIEDGAELLTQILQWPGRWKAHQVGVRLVEVRELRSVTRDLKKCMLWMRDTLVHPNVVRFYGLTELELDRYVVGEYCGKGSMVDILQNDKYNFNNDFKFSLSADIASGMSFLHANGVVHGALSSACCMIDARWTVKVGDWEFYKMLCAAAPGKSALLLLRNKDDYSHAAALRDFWVAPELLRAEFLTAPTYASDVYSFSIILQEIYTREDPYAELADTTSPEEVVRAVCHNHLRPAPTDDIPVRVRQVMEIAWTENPGARPSFDQIVKMLRQSRATRKSVLDSMMEAMEDYTQHLEERVAERSAEVGVAKQKLETLLAHLVPRHLVARLVNGHSLQTQAYSSLGVVAVEVMGVTSALSHASPKDVLTALNDVCCQLDSVVNEHRAFKTVLHSDLHTALLGLESAITFMDQRCACAAHLAFDLVDAAFKAKPVTSDTAKTVLSARAGVHVGWVVTGVVGSASPRFVLLGEGADVAKALVTCSEPARVRTSRNVFSHLEKNIDFMSEEAGWVVCADMEVESYWLRRRSATKAASAPSDHSTDSGVDLENSRPDSCGSENGETEQTLAVDAEDTEVTSQRHRSAAREQQHVHAQASHNSHPGQQRHLCDIVEEEEVGHPASVSTSEHQKSHRTHSLQHPNVLHQTTEDAVTSERRAASFQQQKQHHHLHHQQHQQHQQQQQEAYPASTHQVIEYTVHQQPQPKRPQERGQHEPDTSETRCVVPRVVVEEGDTVHGRLAAGQPHCDVDQTEDRFPFSGNNPFLDCSEYSQSSGFSDYVCTSDRGSKTRQEYQFTYLHPDQGLTPAPFPSQCQHLSPHLPPSSVSALAAGSGSCEPHSARPNQHPHSGSREQSSVVSTSTLSDWPQTFRNSNECETSFSQPSQGHEDCVRPADMTSLTECYLDPIPIKCQESHAPDANFASVPSCPAPVAPDKRSQSLAAKEASSEPSNPTSDVPKMLHASAAHSSSTPSKNSAPTPWPLGKGSVKRGNRVHPQ